MRVKVVLSFLFSLIFLVSCFSALGNQVELVNKYALVIGNSNYSGNAKLLNPESDASDIAMALRQLDFDVTLQMDLDLKGMKTQVGQFSQKLKSPGSIGLFYYAGHGVEVGGRNYLLPIGVNINAAADLEYESIDVQRVVDNMKTARKGMNIVMIDACRNNPFRSFRSLGGTRGIAQMAAPLGTFISSSTASGEVAADGVDRNSPYTKAVLKNISTPGLSLEQLFKKVRVDVLKDTGESQVPWEASSLTSEFYFVSEDSVEEMAQIAEDEKAQELIRVQARKDKEQADQIAKLLLSLENQKQQLVEANREKARLSEMIAQKERDNSTASLNKALVEEEKAKTDFADSINHLTAQQQAVDAEVARLRAEEKELLARKQTQHAELLDICDSMANKYATSVKTAECYQKFLAQEDPDSGRAIRGISTLKDNVISALNLALVDRKVRLAKKNINVLKELSPVLVQSYNRRIEVLEDDIQEAKIETKKKVRSVVTF